MLGLICDTEFVSVFDDDIPSGKRLAEKLY